jgi:MoaA/NifB/PqqE/SkfB family radical SAM enzyme
MQDLRFVWLEITGRCQLTCHHCYAESEPKGNDGVMLPADWRRVIDEVAQLGGRMVQFVGGEPTLYRGLSDLLHHALGQGLEVEVFSNLVRVSSELWETFARRGVRLATSYYSDDAAEHEAITKAGAATPGPRPISPRPCAGLSRCGSAWSTCSTANGLSRPALSWRPSA